MDTKQEPSGLLFRQYVARSTLYPKLSWRESGELPLSLLYDYEYFELFIREKQRQEADKKHSEEH